MNKFLVLFFIIFTITSFAFAAQDSGVYTYQFHLYFDNGKLVKDRDFEFAFDLIAQEYQAPSGNTEYRGEILSVHDKKLADFDFSLGGIAPTGRGKLTVYAPYFDNAKTALFYNPSDREILSVDLAPSGPLCNEDGFCNSDVGEDATNCPADCTVAAPSPTTTPLPAKNVVVFGLTLIQILTWLGAVIAALAAIWFGFKWLAKRRASNQNLQPPENVSPQQPQPPQPPRT